MREGALVRERVAEAEDLLVGLAVPGTSSHDALLALELERRAGRAPAETVVLAALAALDLQSRLSLRAGRHALAVRLSPDETGLGAGFGDDPHWLASTAHEWQRYLRWLVGTHDSLAADVAAMTELRRPAALLAWEQAADLCDEARVVWGALAGVSAEPGAPVEQRGVASAEEDQLDTVVIEGRLYVSVTELAGSLRGRAQAFTDAAAMAAAEDDELGVLVSEVVAEELCSRADSLDLAAIQHAST